MANARIESRIKDGFEVYEVGKSQLWEWAHWAAAGAGNAQSWFGIEKTVDVNAESLAKGVYLVMEVQFCGRVQDAADVLCIQDASTITRVVAQASTRSLKEAIELAGLYKISKPMPTCYPSYIGSVNNFVEVWHVVDDGDLWQEWDLEAAAAGGDLQAARQWKSTFHDDTYLRRIEEHYTGDYHVYDSMVHSPAACIADVTQYDLKAGYKYVYRYWDCCARFLEQRVEDTKSAGVTCRGYYDDGFKVDFVQVYDMDQSECLSVLRDDGSIPVWNPLRVCDVRWDNDYDC